MTTDPLVFDPLREDVVSDPYPLYHRLRSEDPVHQSPSGLWVLTRYDDAAMVLRDRRFGRRGFNTILKDRFGREGLGSSMLFRDPPDHTRLRALVSSAFTSAVVERLRGRIQQLVAEMLARIEPAGKMDLISDFALPLPMTVICEMLGIPREDHHKFRPWTSDIARGLDAVSFPDDATVQRTNTALDGLRTYLGSLIDVRRRHPSDDVVSALIAVEAAGDRLSTRELVSMTAMLLIAGHETTVNLIGNGMLALLRHPEQLEQLRAEPSLIDSAIEECLRYDSPVQRVLRILHEDLVIGGRTIPAGSMMLAALGAANRDPIHFHDPDRFDIRRPDNHHLAFGGGIHFCLGASLARLEARTAIGTLVARLPRIRLASDAVTWRQTFALRGLTALPLEFY